MLNDLFELINYCDSRCLNTMYGLWNKINIRRIFGEWEDVREVGRTQDESIDPAHLLRP